MKGFNCGTHVESVVQKRVHVSVHFKKDFFKPKAVCPFIPINLPRSPTIMEKTPLFLTIQCEIQQHQHHLIVLEQILVEVLTPVWAFELN
jgi:hypothetical protein